MADWDTSKLDYINTVNYNNHSRRSSQGSGFSGSSKENTNSCSDSTVDDSSQRMLILSEGNDLASESRTDMPQPVYGNTIDTSVPGLPTRQPIATLGTGFGTAKAKAARSPFTAPPIDTVPVEEITIPSDANLSTFTSVQLANFLKCLKVDERIISHLYRKSVDGKRFGKMTDSELDTLGSGSWLMTSALVVTKSSVFQTEHQPWNNMHSSTCSL